MTPDLAFNTAVSFMTNANWQNYGGETTLSYFVQMLALTVQNFASAAVGIAVAIALVRGFARKQVNSIGNFWVDLARGTVYVLLPLSLVFGNRPANPLQGDFTCRNTDASRPAASESRRWAF